MIFNKLPSNWVNWRLQGWCQSPYVHNSHVTGNDEAGHSPEAVYQLRTIHIVPHHRQQFKSRLPSTRLDGVIYVTEAAKKRKWPHTSNEVHLRRINEDLRNTYDSHLAMPPMAVPIASTFCKSNRIIYVMDDVRSSLLRLWKSYKAIYSQQINESTMITDMITDMITGIICLSMGAVEDSWAAIADRVVAP